MNSMNRSIAAVAATIAPAISGFGAHQVARAHLAMPASAAECASCHADNATTEMLFGNFYPILGWT